MSGFLGFDGPGTSNTAAHSDHPLLAGGAVSPSSFGAAFDGVTDDTAAWNQAILQASNQGAGALIAPVARTLIAGQISLLPGVWITGTVPGPYDIGRDPTKGKPLAPTFLVTNTTNSPFLLASRDSGVQDIIVHYPNQVAPTSATPTSYPATFSTPTGSAGNHVRRVTMTNAYQGFSLLGGRHFLTDINAGCFSNVATVDNSADVIHFTRIVASPFWNNAAGLNYPQTIDTWVANNRADWIFYRADGHVMTDYFGFAGNIGIQMLDSSLPISPLTSYGYGTGVSFDSYFEGIICKSTNSPGWQFSNLGIAASGTSIIMANGGGTAPKLRVRGGTFWGAAKIPANTAGGLDIEGVENVNPTGASATTPGVPSSTSVLANPNPYSCLVCITAGASTCAVGMGPAQPTGFTLAASGTATVVLAANEGIKLTYSSAPTWVWFGI